MKCPRCNAQLVDDASFCGICGYATPVLQGNAPEVRPSLRSPGNNEATLVAAPWPDGQPGVGTQRTSAPAWSGQPGTLQGSGQAMNQQGLVGAWPQQPPQGNWAAEPVQQQFGGNGGMQPGNLNRAGVAQRPPVRRRGRAGRVWLSIFLTLVVLLALAAGAWFAVGRPYLHNLALTQLDQSLSTPENEVLLTMSAIPSGIQLPASLRVVRSTETAMNARLSGYNNDQVQNLHMTITPSGLTLSFSVYGQDCTISALPVLSNGQLQVTNVQVQGLMSLIMTNDELTSALNDNLQRFSLAMTHKIEKLTLLDHEMDVQLA